MNKREAEFLAAQNSRLAKLKSHNNNGKGPDDENPNDVENNIQLQRKSFWSTFKDEYSSLSSRLDALKCSSGGNKHNATVYVTAQQRNAALSKLQDIQRTIRAIDHYIINSQKKLILSSASATTNDDDRSKEYLAADFRNYPMPDLPPADQRLVDVYMLELKESASTLQNIIVPKDKFRFRRYRAACQNQPIIELNQQQQGEKNKIDDADHNAKVKALHNLFNGMSLTNKNNCNIIVRNDGFFERRSSSSEDVESASSIGPDGDISTSFLVKCVCNCQISVEGVFESMHIIDATNTTLDIAKPIKGPVHVTNCQDTIIHIAFCRQLRIHDCANVTFKCHVGSGPIIEGCKQMKFHQRDYHHPQNNEDGEDYTSQNLYWDVKDFLWLKTLVKSPNFEVFSQEEEKINEDTHESCEKNTTATVDNKQESSSLQFENDTEIEQDEESSDEDEL